LGAVPLQHVDGGLELQLSAHQVPQLEADASSEELESGSRHRGRGRDATCCREVLLRLTGLGAHEAPSGPRQVRGEAFARVLCQEECGIDVGRWVLGVPQSLT
jgi:hypothetical protein